MRPALDVFAAPPMLWCPNPAWHWQDRVLYCEGVPKDPSDWIHLRQLPDLRIPLPPAWRTATVFPYVNSEGDVFTMTAWGAVGYAGNYDGDDPPSDAYLRDVAAVDDFGCFAADLLPLFSAQEAWEAEHG